MPFDPTKPAAGSPDSSAEMRAQLNGLKEISDAIAATNITNVVVDSVTTLDPGQPATVTVNVNGNALHLGFGIPRGATGDTGAAGSQGNPGGDGPSGPQGLPGTPGEVSAADLAAALATTSSNSNSVGVLGMTISDPPLQSEVQALSAKIDQIILALRR